MIVDLEQTHFVDSAGLELLLWARRRCDELFGRLKLVNVADPVRKILEVTRLDHRLECPGDLAAGLKSDALKSEVRSRKAEVKTPADPPPAHCRPAHSRTSPCTPLPNSPSAACSSTRAC